MTASATSRLQLPFLQAGQALKNITHNEALQRLDTGLYLACSNMAADILPNDPAPGLAIIISESPDAALAGHIGHIAVFVNGSWIWFIPKSGWTVWDDIGQALRVFGGTGWVDAVPQHTPSDLPLLGLNASASPTQRLSVASDTTLFNHDGDSHRLTLNRATATDTASLIFQTNFAGEAELGLTGDGGFSLKTSPDGVIWSDRLNASATDSGIQSPAFTSKRITIASDTAALIPTPSSGGIMAMTVISDTVFPEGRHSALISYDTANAPMVVSLTVTSRIENLGTGVLDGTISGDGNIGLSAVNGGIYIENRLAHDRQFSLTFLC